MDRGEEVEPEGGIYKSRVVLYATLTCTNEFTLTIVKKRNEEDEIGRSYQAVCFEFATMLS